MTRTEFISYAHKYRVDHLLLGLAFIIILTLITGNLILAWALQCAFWFGREIRDTEIQLAIKLPEQFYEAYNMLNWKQDTLLDFWIPVIGNGLIVLGVNTYAS